MDGICIIGPHLHHFPKSEWGVMPLGQYQMMLGLCERSEPSGGFLERCLWYVKFTFYYLGVWPTLNVIKVRHSLLRLG